MFRIHRRIALIALERGLLTGEDLCDAMAYLGAVDDDGEEVGLEVWFDNGWLDQAHMAEVMAELGMLPSILVLDGARQVTPELDGSQDALRIAAEGRSEDSIETGEQRRDDVDSVTRTLMHGDEVSRGEPTQPNYQREETTNVGRPPQPEPGYGNGQPSGGRSRRDEATREVDTADQHRTLAWAKSGVPAAPGEITQIRELSSDNRYVLGRELGSGGGGRVVRAYDRALGRTVAMKVMLSDGEPDGKAVSRFMAEAQATGQLEHPNIVPIYDFGALPTGELFYTMREVRRHSLRDALAGLKRGAPNYVDEYTLVGLMSVLRQVSQAVHYAHVRGVVHRDLKPDNIMVGEYGEVLVMDWGLARILERPARMNLAEKAQLEEQGHTLGTPAYMPPEQARGELDEVDEQSDVYGLGAILYEILSLEAPFVADGPIETMWAVLEAELEPPSQRAPDRHVPLELQRICMRAMSRDKPNRYRTARDFAEELEDWIEGLQPREARRRVEAGRRASQLYEELSIRTQTLDQRAREVAAAIEGWEPIEEKEELWSIEDQRDQAQVEQARAFGEAVSAFTQALAYQPDNDEARKGLLNLYWRRLEDARGRNQVVDAIYFEALVRQYDDGRFSRMLDGSAGIEVVTTPAGAEATLHQLEEVERRLRPSEDGRHLGTTPLESAELEEGAHLLEIAGPHGQSIRRPVRLTRGRSEVVNLTIPAPELFREGFVFVPQGEYIAGGDPEAFDPRPQRFEHVDAFFCAVYPVTFAEYLAFVNELWADDPDQARERAPQTRAEEGLLVRLDPERNAWVPDEILIEGPARAMYPVGEGHEDDIPVVGIRYEDAVAYAAWRSARDGATYRLPTESELEKAGRGVDGRFFPWGNRFDPTFCKMRFSRRVLPQLEPVGVFLSDSSPFGVRDLAGGVQEWCFDASESHVDRPVKGGSWNQDQRAARLASRVRILAAARSAGIGMRLVYEP